MTHKTLEKNDEIQLFSPLRGLEVGGWGGGTAGQRCFQEGVWFRTFHCWIHGSPEQSKRLATSARLENHFSNGVDVPGRPEALVIPSYASSLEAERPVLQSRTPLLGFRAAHAVAILSEGIMTEVAHRPSIACKILRVGGEKKSTESAFTRITASAAQKVLPLTPQRLLANKERN